VQLVDADGVIVDTPPRDRVWLAQTPQAFPREALLAAYRAARAEGFAATDDAALFARYAGPVRVVQGSPRNLKLTRPGDLALLEALALAGPGEADE
jgi:2-C-methyl-D-erythritol 4-phosphate cytidylyltransferase